MTAASEQGPQEEREFWETAGPENLWNGPGDGLEHLHRIVRALDPLMGGAGRFVIDLGCGAGRLLCPMAERFPWVSFVGIDIAFRPILDRPGNVSMLRTSGRRLLYREAQIDAAWSVLLFQHLPPDGVAAYLRELHRVLRPGGRIVFQFVARTAFDPETGGAAERDGFLNYSYTESQMGRMVEDAGFASWELEQDENRWRWITADKEPAE